MDRDTENMDTETENFCLPSYSGSALDTVPESYLCNISCQENVECCAHPQVSSELPRNPQNLYPRTAERTRTSEIQAKGKIVKKHEFLAHPVPKAVLNGQITGVKKRLLLPVTIAKTPNFALKKRAEKWRNRSKLNQTTIENQSFRALPAPGASAPALKHEKKYTDMQPFSFDSKDKEKLSKKIKQEIEKENLAYTFKAQPMPGPVSTSLPQVKKKLPTLPIPFSFHEGGSSKRNNLSLLLNQTLSVFKAKPATVLKKPPFIPEKSEKLPVEVEEFHLSTDVRASERQKLKEINDLKELEKQRALQELKWHQEEKERREIARLRQGAVPKANPIRHYKPVEIKYNSKSLTVPVTPMFKTEERLKLRNCN